MRKIFMSYTPSNLVMQWHITDRCNQQCTHCYIDEKSKDLDFEQLLHILDQYILFLKSHKTSRGSSIRGHINITGGEPFIRDDFINLLEIFAANKMYFSYGILTNGTLIDDSIAKYLKKLGAKFVQVSLDGSEPTHDNIRGKGNFKRIEKALKILNKAEIETLISFTALKSNFREFKDVVKIGRKHKVFRVWSDRFIPLGDNSESFDEVLSPEETKEYIEMMNQLRLKEEKAWFKRTEVKLHRALQFTSTGCQPYCCAAGKTLITVLSNGDLCPCRRMPIKAGNLLETPLKDLYYNTDVFNDLRDFSKVQEGCQSCKYVGYCCGGLRCLSYAVTGSPFNADPGCWLAKQN